jgi:putative addiction module component (TIGR02574 family)
VRYGLRMIAAAEIEQMTVAERIEAMELLWRSISAKPERVISPAWHGEVLQKRLSKIEAGKAEFLTVAQFKKRLSKRSR